jgi:hypothetical protein
MSDGLSQLAQRGRRTREIPPPRNPARSEPVHLTPVPDETPEAETAPVPAASRPPVRRPKAPAAPPSPQPAGNEVKEPPAKPAGGPARQAATKPALKVVTIYLEQDDDDFLETITHTGRTSQPKTAISRSAVVRLALERLHTQMSPEQVVDELRPRGDQPGTGTGRKRR